MYRALRQLTFIAIVIAAFCTHDTARAAHPPYLILRQAHGGVAQPTVGHPYAYGWFGVAPRQHTITHTGDYRSHWLWPGRLPQ